LEGVEKIQQFGGRALLADEMGLGKTLQTLYWIWKYSKWPVLVICPAHLKWVWYMEAFTHFRIRPRVLSGTKPQREWDNWTKQILIINYDILHHWMEYLQKISFQCGVIDECHYIKNPRAIRTKQVQKIFRHTPHLIAVSGTPILSRPIELFPTLHLLRRDLFPSFFDYAFHYCKPTLTLHGWVYKGAENLDELHRRLRKHLMIRRQKKDVISQLPSKIRKILPVELPKDSMEEYRKAEKNFLQWLRGFSSVKALRASRAVMVSKMGYLKRLAAEMKKPYLFRWIDDFLDSSEQKLVIFGVHRAVLIPLYERYKSIAVKIDGSTTARKRKTAVQEFQNNPKIRLFIGNIQAAGTGLTLTSASNTLFAELDWNPANLTQAEDRTHRIGQKTSTTYYYLIAKDTIEEYLCRLVQQKQTILIETLDGSRRTNNSLDIFTKLNKVLQKETTQ